MEKIKVTFKNGAKKEIEVANFSTGEFSSDYERDQKVKFLDKGHISKDIIFRVDFEGSIVYINESSLDEVNFVTDELYFRDCDISHCTLSAEEIILNNCQMTAVTIKGKVRLEGENSFSEGKERYWNRGDSVPCKIITARNAPSEVEGKQGGQRMIMMLTGMAKIPDNCKDCPQHHCQLPLKENKYQPELKKKYMTTRHKDCPLRDVDIKED